MQKMAVLAAAFALTTVLAARADDDKKMDTPEKCVEAYKSSALKADGKGMLACFSAASRKKLLEQAGAELKEVLDSADSKSQAAKELEVKAEDLDKMSAEDYLSAKLATMTKKDKEKVEKTKFVVSKKDDENAIVTIDDGSKSKTKLALVKKDGVWGIDLDASQKLGDEGDEGDEKDEKGEGSK